MAYQSLGFFFEDALFFTCYMECLSLLLLLLLSLFRGKIAPATSWNHMIVYKLLVLNKKTLNHTGIFR